MPDGDLPDPLVHVFLKSGKVLELHNISVMEMGKRLMHYGVTTVSNSRGSYLLLFDHGVEALSAGDISFDYLKRDR